MFIRDVCMNGFKCYTDSVTIKNIDRSFTAITGMNGSGKSNIIDAIVFALDLNTSKYMRVSNLKELINIGRKECTVTLIFDNTEKKSSPGGYEGYDTIEVSRSLDHEGKSKYRLNGHNATKTSIDSLCKSIGITNNFIVMQGQITKIVNMKSVDLKNMIEETAGTRNYSQERERSLELLEKKEFKLREAREHLQKTISPFFDQLKKEKKIYEENKDLEENRKRYMEEMKVLEAALMQDELREKTGELSKLASQYITETAELEEIEAKAVDTQCAKSNRVDFEIQLNNYRNKLEDLKAMQIDELLTEKLALRSEMEANAPSLNNSISLDELKEREAILSKELGSSSNDKISELERTRELLNRKENEMKRSSSRVREEYARVSKYLNAVESENSQNGNRLDLYKNLYKEYSQGANKLRKLEETITMMKSKLVYPVLDGVYGTVDENFDFIDEKYKEAIMTILGGRAKFIICRDEEIASHVLKSSDRRVSCIPLSKISYSEPMNVPYKCLNALNAITFDRKYEKAFKHIFSGFFLFEDSEQASRCCFERKVLCVTLDGTVYDPKGTLTGGKSNFKYSVTKLSELMKFRAEYDNIARTTPSTETINDLKSFISSIELNEAIETEVSRLRSKNEMLEKLCSSKLDISKELEQIRNSIVEVSKSERQRALTEKRRLVIEREISELVGKKKEITKQERDLQMKIRQLETEKSKWAKEEETRKMSIKMYEVFDEKRKGLIKSTVKLASRISKLYEEIGPLAEGQSTARKTDSFFSMETLAMLGDKFGISPDIFNLRFNTPQNFDRAESEGRIQHLREKINQKRIAVSMNPTNFELLEKNTLLVQTLEEKIQKLEKDRKEIIESIETLNTIGLNENKKAFDHVNKHVKIFLQYFLPNTDIVITNDFEIKVKIGNWKNSLSELSGGQKSLIALCLIFSMLTFRPAPFYIFDEIDAALDLNYTQSIGEIIKNEFKGAQFIVISLKNNMFDSAQKIFKVVIQDHRPRIIAVK